MHRSKNVQIFHFLERQKSTVKKDPLKKYRFDLKGGFLNWNSPDIWIPFCRGSDLAGWRYPGAHRDGRERDDPIGTFDHTLQLDSHYWSRGSSPVHHIRTGIPPSIPPRPVALPQNRMGFERWKKCFEHSTFSRGGWVLVNWLCRARLSGCHFQMVVY